jgi:hypothetical protein
MSAPLCRCGREKWQHEPLPVNSYSPACRDYDPMDFTPFELELSGEDGKGCHCDLCNDLKYAANKHAGRDWVPLSNILYDALLAGTHAHRSWTEWTDKLRANHVGGDLSCNGRGYQSAGSFMKSGTGIGMTPGGITGSTHREENSR